MLNPLALIRNLKARRRKAMAVAAAMDDLMEVLVNEYAGRRLSYWACIADRWYRCNLALYEMIAQSGTDCRLLVVEELEQR